MTTAPFAEVAVAVLAPDTVRFGAVVSCTFTVKVLSPLFPALSVAEQVTVVVTDVLGRKRVEAKELVLDDSAPPIKKEGQLWSPMR